MNERTYVVNVADLWSDRPGAALLATHRRVVDVAEVERLRAALAGAQASLEAASKDHDCDWCGDCAHIIEVALRAKEAA